MGARTVRSKEQRDDDDTKVLRAINRGCAKRSAIIQETGFAGQHVDSALRRLANAGKVKLDTDHRWKLTGDADASPARGVA